MKKTTIFLSISIILVLLMLVVTPSRITRKHIDSQTAKINSVKYQINSKTKQRNIDILKEVRENTNHTVQNNVSSPVTNELTVQSSLVTFDTQHNTTASTLLKDLVTKTGTLGSEYPLVSKYGERDNYGGQISSYHRGLDFAMDVGTELVAPADGLVLYTGYQAQRGYWVVLSWNDDYCVEYQHLSEIFVNTGDTIQKGDVVALSGETGASIIPHLHLEVIQLYPEYPIIDYNNNYNRVDPYNFVFGDNNAVYGL